MGLIPKACNAFALNKKRPVCSSRTKRRISSSAAKSPSPRRQSNSDLRHLFTDPASGATNFWTDSSSLINASQLTLRDCGDRSCAERLTRYEASAASAKADCSFIGYPRCRASVGLIPKACNAFALNKKRPVCSSRTKRRISSSAAKSPSPRRQSNSDLRHLFTDPASGATNFWTDSSSLITVPGSARPIHYPGKFCSNQCHDTGYDLAHA